MVLVIFVLGLARRFFENLQSLEDYDVEEELPKTKMVFYLVREGANNTKIFKKMKMRTERWSGRNTVSDQVGVNLMTS